MPAAGLANKEGREAAKGERGLGVVVGGDAVVGLAALRQIADKLRGPPGIECIRKLKLISNTYRCSCRCSSSGGDGSMAHRQSFRINVFCKRNFMNVENNPSLNVCV